MITAYNQDMKTENQQSDWVIDVELPEDVNGVRAVNLAAFEQPGEATVVDRLREGCPDYHSLVARIGQRVVGHILFTPARIVLSIGQTVEGMGLAPLAVHPELQGRGIGSALCREGLSWIKHEGWPFVIVLGHPAYYPRFGFEPADRYGITCAFADVPPEAFMIRIFKARVLAEISVAGFSATAYYQPEFDEVT